MKEIIKNGVVAALSFVVIFTIGASQNVRAQDVRHNFSFQTLTEKAPSRRGHKKVHAEIPDDAVKTADSTPVGPPEKAQTTSTRSRAQRCALCKTPVTETNSLSD